ncbi:50S ribosomal protein L24 [Candidatus Marinamargulisbacteria bacterium SCGC AG-333-B06]|nr:50S ribosomal protein L24 [Candidatus Marinamargulisbacteria bacterium SCGC AG-333-B06]
MNKFKKDDKIIVISGKDKGKISKISKVFPKSQSVLLDNCHFVTKHLKPNQQSQGGIKQLAKQISWSKIKHYDESCKKGSRVQFIIKNTKKIRVLKTSQKEL